MRHQESTHVTSRHVIASAFWSSGQQRHDVVLRAERHSPRGSCGSAVGQPLRTVEETRTRLNLLGVRAQSGDSYLESTRKPAEAARAGVVREVRLAGRHA